MVQKKGSTITYVPSNFRIHRFESEVPNHKVIVQVLKMVDSLLIFINYKDDLKFTDLSMAVKSRYNNNLPVQTQLVGSLVEDSSKILAGKLAKKLNKTVFVSCNVQSDNINMSVIEKALFDGIKRNPDAF